MTVDRINEWHVGWWCPTCDVQWMEYPNTVIRQHTHPVIPVFRPLDVPEPTDVDEVETGEAEVVTWTSPTKTFRIGSNDVAFTEYGYAIGHWFDEPEYTASNAVIVDLAAASAL